MKRSQRFTVGLVKLHPWPHKDRPRHPPPPLPMFFADETDAIDEAILLAADQYGVAVVGDELEGELVAQVDAKKQEVMLTR